MMNGEQSSPAVVINEDTWARLVTFRPDPSCETERLHRLVRLALKTLAASTRSEITTGFFCLPGDGSVTTPLWQQFHLRNADGVVHISLTN
ncbi:hypothetical protein BIY29_17695 [Brenneria alni]|uniref:Uncharacterized protein n=1 Tax=Brenneria alni TaxID=71656 RepID=A0A421DJJ7_9GAMM|nr:hypothetical protein [Brenneria alni]RLM18821.1 hypothetical protein BIY29_17695 [Brenneria alni]